MSLRYFSSFVAHNARQWKVSAGRSFISSMQNSNRKLSLSAQRHHSKSYDADGKTKVSVLNQELDVGLMINGFSQFGFRLNNGMVIMGPMAIFPRSVLSWNVNSFHDINEDSLKLFYMMEPKIDILVLGIGDEKVLPEFSKRVIGFINKYKINVEVLRTEQACATFNFLNSENRIVAAAMIPPVHISYNENDVLQKKIRNRELYTFSD